MKRWYSPRGARRGILLATLAAAIWAGWALAYTRNAAIERSANLPIKTPSNHSTSKQIDTSCCLRQIGV